MSSVVSCGDEVLVTMEDVDVRIGVVLVDEEDEMAFSSLFVVVDDD